ncbi:hypothetical protein [Streptomyces durhamensis]|uniref:hypothetical protein n=1 Tax=Streptomyces durhamensis TaxID=68194 RepID=UPI0004CD997D|nr:hypothetical protein [Streptomyces durhamensis]
MTAADRLYAQLPAAIRVSDAEAGEPLRALLSIIGEQADALAADMARGYDNLFIETCEDWVVPYLAELIGAVPLYDAARSQDDATALIEFEDLRGPRLLPPAGASARADIARTIALRRRKGTVFGIADIAHYASGFPVHLVEGLARTGWTQHLRHSRPDLGTARPTTRLDSSLTGTPFDRTSRFADVRRPDGPRGWYHPAHVTIAVHRQRAVAHRRVMASPADRPWRFRLDPLGLDRPLFTPGSRDAELPPQLQAAAVPAPLAPALFETDLLAHRQAPLLPPADARPAHTVLYGAVGEEPGAPAASLGVWLDKLFVTPAADETAPDTAYAAQVVSRRLAPWPAARPTGRVLAVDVRHGRVAVGDQLALPSELRASFFHGAAGTIGGGNYDRSGWLVGTAPDQVITVAAQGADRTALTDALTDWAASTARHTLVRLLDSETYRLPGDLALAGRTLVIEAADLERPVLRPVTQDAVLTVDGDGSLTLSGVALDGRITTGAELARLRLLHCTLPPGGAHDATGAPLADGPSLRVSGPSPRLRVQLAFSILGEIVLDAAADEVLLLDSVLSRGTGTDTLGGPAAPETGLRAERSTFLGKVSARTVEASECLFGDRVMAARTQQGCLRYCYVAPDGSRTPRRFACQPELAVARALAGMTDLAARAASAAAERRRVRPVFVSRRYGDPGFAQLGPSCPAEIATGAEDGSEIGAYGHVKQAQRLDNLRRRLDEYLPAGITAGTSLIN